ncbi:MAG: terminase small subunit [Clostridiales bacterium]|nr:terminase small subunit [Clostridiales bacterium]
MSKRPITPYKVGDKLTLKQERWIDEYLKTNDYTTASRNAGYTGNNLRSIGYQNSLKFKDLINERRQKLSKEIEKSTIATLEEIFEFWTKTFKDGNIKDADRIKASELLAKAKGGFIEKVEVKKVNTDWFIDEDTDNGKET